MEYQSLFPSSYNKHTVHHFLPLAEESLYNTKYDVVQGSGVYRNQLLPNALYKNVHPTIDTHAKLFDNAVKLYGDRKCLGSRKFNHLDGTNGDEYVPLSYNEVNKRKLNLGSGILHTLINNPYIQTLHPSIREKVQKHTTQYQNYWTTITAGGNKNYQVEEKISFILSIFSANRAEWVLTDLACGAYAITNTALYDNLGPDVTKYILEMTKSPVVVCSGDKIELLLDFKEKEPKLSNVIQIVSMDPVSEELEKKASKLGIFLRDIDEIESIGAQNPTPQLDAHPESIFTISFTSGTTGARPKGVMLTNANAVAAISSLQMLEPRFERGESPRAFIFLPLTHIYERQTSGFAWSSGYYLGFPQLANGKSPAKEPFDKLLEDLRLFQPHYFSIVPRLLTKLQSFVKTSIKKTGANQQQLRALTGMEHLVWTQTASAPVAPSTLSYLMNTLGIGIRQLYGMTETYGAMTTSPIKEDNPGSCGSVFPSQEIKLAPSLGMDDGRGELLVRGANNCKGYYYNYEETCKLYEEDLWLHTGDVAKIDEKTGRLYIVDRVKNFFKLAQGEYVSPEKIENRYLSSNPIINQLYVHGDSVHSYLVGIVGIDLESGTNFLKEQGIVHKLTPTQMLEIINKMEHKRCLLSVLNKNVEKTLLSIEKLHNIHIEINPLTTERDVVTPTFKIKRGVAAKFFKSIFDRLYDDERSLIRGAKL